MNQNSSSLSRRDFQKLLTIGLAAATFPAVVLTEAAAKEPAKVKPIRLHFNENPAGLSPSARVALDELLELAWQYPDQSRGMFHTDLATLHGIARDRILLGNGSSEPLALAAQTFSGPGRPLVTADPTYDGVAEYASPFNTEVKKTPLGKGYSHDLGRMVEAVGKAGLLYICNPNNPTGTITPKADVRNAIGAVPNDVTIVVDEAYHHYVVSDDYESVIPMIEDHANLVVLRTFSKIYGMAGLRCGYAIAQPETLGRMRERQARNNLNIAALLAARASLGDVAWVEESKKRNYATRSKLMKELEKMGYGCTPSQASFLMINLETNTRPLAKAMKERGILVGRPFPPMTDFLRLSIGTPSQMDRFLDEFGKMM